MLQLVLISYIFSKMLSMTLWNDGKLEYWNIGGKSGNKPF